MVIEPRCARHGSLDQVCRSTLRFPPQGPPGRVPLLQRYYQSATTPCRPSRRASFPSLGGTSVSLVGFAPRRTSAPSRPGVGHPVTPAGIWPRRRQGLPSSWGISIVRLPCSKPTPAGLLAPDQYSAAAWPLVFQKQRLPRKVFRRSIAWLSDSLSTLRSAGYPNPTQDSLPAAGQALPDGLSTRKTPLRGFRSASYISSSSPKLLGTMKSTDASQARARRNVEPSFPATVPPAAWSVIPQTISGCGLE